MKAVQAAQKVDKHGRHQQPGNFTAGSSGGFTNAPSDKVVGEGTQSGAFGHVTAPRLVSPIEQENHRLRAELDLTRRQLKSYAHDLRTLHVERQKAEWTLNTMGYLESELGRSVQGAFRGESVSPEDFSSLSGETIWRLILAMQLHDQETSSHLWRVSRYTRLLSERLGFSSEDVSRISEAAPLHDVGKIGVSNHILNKPGPLNPDEWEQMKQHTVYGAKLLHGSKFDTMRIAEIIALTHHERWDGTGYPFGLKGDQIPMAGHVTMLCDQYDALRSERPYKRGLTHEEACKVILEGDGRTQPDHFSPRILAVFSEFHRQFDEIWACGKRLEPDSNPREETDPFLLSLECGE